MPTDKSIIKLLKYEGNDFVPLFSLPQKFFTDEILLFTCENDYKVFQILTSSYKTLGDIKGGYVGRGKSRSSIAITGKNIRKFGYKNISLPNKGNQIFIQNIYSAESGIIAAFGGNLEASKL